MKKKQSQSHKISEDDRVSALKAIANGSPIKLIAKNLGVAENTVRYWLKVAKAKDGKTTYTRPPEPDLDIRFDDVTELRAEVRKLRALLGDILIERALR